MPIFSPFGHDTVTILDGPLRFDKFCSINYDIKYWMALIFILKRAGSPAIRFPSE